MLIRILTGEQAISFFAQHGNSTPIKFLNCNRAAVPPQLFRPYDLTVVFDEKELKDEYFTVSAQGVVHILPEKGTALKKASKFGAVPTEFFSLSDWMQQSTMFNVLTSMKYFKHYLIGKVFGLWKGNVRFKMFNRTR
jgi:dynein heavy chain